MPVKMRNIAVIELLYLKEGREREKEERVGEKDNEDN